MIKWSEKYGKWEGFANGQLVTRCESRERVARKLKKVYGIEDTGDGNNQPEVQVKVSEFSVEERFEFIENFTKLVAGGTIPSLVITGSGGLGKTRAVTDTLQKSLKLKEDTGIQSGDFVFIKGYTTPRVLYTTLWEYRNKIVIFDDCDSAHKDPIAANILKAALDSGERRIVSWGSEGRDESIPTRFEFTGKVIFISNMTIDKFPQALISRSMLVDLTLNLEEKIDRIASIFKKERDYEKEDKEAVLAFIKENKMKFKDLNIRSAFNTLKMKIALGENWEKMALYSATLN